MAVQYKHTVHCLFFLFCFVSRNVRCCLLVLYMAYYGNRGLAKLHSVKTTLGHVMAISSRSYYDKSEIVSWYLSLLPCQTTSHVIAALGHMTAAFGRVTIALRSYHSRLRSCHSILDLIMSRPLTRATPPPSPSPSPRPQWGRETPAGWSKRRPSVRVSPQPPSLLED